MAGQHNRIVKRIRQIFEPAALEAICEAEESAFSRFGQLYETADHKRFYYYRNTGSKILAVAHLDYVAKPGPASVVELKGGSKVVFAPSLDDRLGAWVILDLLPRLGIKTDILLTTGEETGNSTAELFTAPKDRQYNWMFQFDRTGTDVVMYKYRQQEHIERLKAIGFETAYGSFSDICRLDHLGCTGFNFGVGYQDYHSRRAYAFLDDTFDMVARFVRFYHLYRHKAWAYTPSKWESNYSSYSSYDTGQFWDEYYQRGNGYKSKNEGRKERKSSHSTWHRSGQVSIDGGQHWMTLDEYERYKFDLKRKDAEDDPDRAGIVTKYSSESDAAFIERVKQRLHKRDHVSWDDESLRCMCGHFKYIHFGHTQGFRKEKSCGYWKCKCVEYTSKLLFEQKLLTAGEI